MKRLEIESVDSMASWLSKYEWDFFFTTTFEYRATQKQIANFFDGLYFKCYWVEGLVWVQEFTKEGLPHVHGFVKTKNKDKSYKTLYNTLKKVGNTIVNEYDPNIGEKGFKYAFKAYNITNNYSILVDFPKRFKVHATRFKQYRKSLKSKMTQFIEE